MIISIDKSRLLAALQIVKSRISKLDTQDPSLYSGLSGKTLFYSYAAAYSGNQLDYDQSINAVKKVIENLNQTSQKGSFADGFTGIAWLLQHLQNEKLIEGITDEQISLFDSPIIQTLKIYQQNGNYDPLYGALGIGLYYLEKSRNNCNQLKSVIDFLIDASVTQNQSVFWLDKVASPAGVNSPNLGLSHGVTGINLFLCKCIKVFRELEKQGSDSNSLQYLKKTTELLTQSTFYLLNQQKPAGKSLFPNNAGVVEESRLGWSYGDLGIAIGIIKASISLNNDRWLKEGINIALSTCQRDLTSSQVYEDHYKIPDVGFCNGLAGIATLYQSLFQLTNNHHFNHATNKWVNHTIEAIFQANTQYGLKNVPNVRTHWWNDLSLIKGLSGIGLSLTSFLGISYSAWKKSFLLLD